MAVVSVSPESFHFVSFDAGRIAGIVSVLADRIGFPADAVIEVEIDERTPLARVRIESIDPVRLHVEGGAIEEATAPRSLSDRLVADVVGRLLVRVRDRLTPGFGPAPADSELTLAQSSAWDAYCMGRLERIGYDVRRPRRQYHFRNRHGFNDVVDRVFARLWAEEALTWADLQHACDETAAVEVVA